MAGRGRGRGRGALAPEPAKPGGTPKDPMDQLSAMVHSLALDAADEKELLPIKEIAAKAGTSPEKLHEVVQTLYQRCQEDWRFSACAAKVCCELEASGLEADGQKFRNSLLSVIQTDFKNKDKLRTESPKMFLGNIAFMCQVFAQMRDKEGAPFKPMSAGVMEGLELLLEEKASEDEMFCAASQLYAVGKTLNLCIDRIKITALRNRVKDKIIYAIGSKEVRAELLKVVEGFASDWKHYS